MTKGDADSSDAGEGGTRRSRSEFVKQYRLQAELIHKLAERRDQLVVTGAAGAIIISITFLDSIAPDPKPWTLWLLVVSWGNLLLSLGCALWSLVSSEQAHRELQEKFVAEQQGVRKDTDRLEELDKRTDRLDKTALWSLLLGAVLLVTFASVNVFHQDGSMPDDNGNGQEQTAPEPPDPGKSSEPSTGVQTVDPPPTNGGSGEESNGDGGGNGGDAGD